MITPIKKHIWRLATRLRAFKSQQIPSWARFAHCYFLQAFQRPIQSATFHKHLVILAWEFPPVVTAGVYRPASFARYASENGWQVSVICGPAPDAPTKAGLYLSEIIPDAVTVYRVGATPQWPHPAPLPRIDGGIGNALNVYERASEILEGLPPGIIFASGPPFHNFVAATWLAKRYGWQLALDYRDEWSHNPFHFVMNDRTNARWEARCLKQADHVVFTTQSQLEHHGRDFPSLLASPTTKNAKGSVIFNGWEPRDFAADSANVDTQAFSNKPFTLAFFGNLGPMAHPGEFLDTLSAVYNQYPELIASTQVAFVGYKQEAVATQLSNFAYPDNLLLLEQVSKAEAVVMMREANALLLLNTPALMRYLQGKLYDYMASETPILFFGEGGEMADVIEAQNAGMVIPYADPNALALALQGLMTNDLQPAASKKAWLQSRTREHQAQRLLTTLNTLIEADGSEVKQP